MVRDVADAGTAVVYTTHYLEEAERLCDRIAIVDHGKVLAEGTLDELKARVGEEEVGHPLRPVRGRAARDRSGRSPRRAGDLPPRPGVCGVRGGGGGTERPAPRRDLSGSGLAVDRIAIEPPSLNALFLKLTGRELRD